MATTPIKPSAASGTSISGAKTNNAKTGGSRADVDLKNLPQPLQKLDRAMLLSGTLTSRRDDGTYILKTSQGEITLRAHTPLPLNRQIMLKIPAGNPPSRAFIMIESTPQKPESKIEAKIQEKSRPQPIIQKLAPNTPLTLRQITQPTLIEKILATKITPNLPPQNAAPKTAQTMPKTLPQNPPQNPNQNPPSHPIFQKAGLPTTQMRFPEFNQPLNIATNSQKPIFISPAQNISTTTQNIPQAPVPQIGQSQAEALFLPPKTIIPNMPPLKTNLNTPNPRLNSPSSPQTPPIPTQNTPQKISLETLPKINFKLLAIQPKTTPLTPLPKTQISTIFEGTTTRGDLILRKEHSPKPQLFLLRHTTPPPPNSRLILQQTSPSPAQIQAPQTTQITPKNPVTPLTINPSFLATNQDETWPTLQQIMASLQATNPAAAQVLQQITPQPTPQFIPATLFFITALRLGDARTWLGANIIKTLEKNGQKHLIKTLEDDFSRINKSSLSPSKTMQNQDEWRPLPLPIFNGNHIERLNFYTHYQQNKNEESSQNQPKETRFLINLTLKKLGKIQLDGFFSKQNLDIILRAENGLTEPQRSDLRHLYYDNITAQGLTGNLSFKNTHDHSWITP